MQVEATGAEKLANDSINFVRRGGTLMLYGVYDNDARVHWPPSKIFGDEIQVTASSGVRSASLRSQLHIQIIGSFAQTYCFPRAVAYLESGRINVNGMVSNYGSTIPAIRRDL